MTHFELIFQSHLVELLFCVCIRPCHNNLDRFPMPFYFLRNVTEPMDVAMTERKKLNFFFYLKKIIHFNIKSITLRSEPSMSGKYGTNEP